VNKSFFCPEPKFFAHRGASLEYPENTFPSFSRAVEIGVDVIETDVHITSDRRFVVIHDDMVERLSDGEGRVSEMNLNAIKKLDAGYRFTPDKGLTFPFRDKGIRFMTLEEMLDAFPDQRFNIDLKDKNTEIVSLYIDIIKKHKAAQRVLTASFYTCMLKRVRALMPEMATSAGVLEMFMYYVFFKTGLHFFMKKVNPDAFQVPERYGPLHITGKRLIDQAHDRGLRVHVWTIDNEKDMKRLYEKGVDAVMTNDPLLFRQVFEKI